MIAAVQAFILKQLVLESDVVTWKTIEAKKCDQLLVKAMIEIINQAADARDPKYSIVHANDSFLSNKEASADSKSAKSAVNLADDTSESSQIDKTHLIRQASLEPESFHSQLRYIFIDILIHEMI